MSGGLTLRNRQRARAVNLRLLRRITRALLQALWPREVFELGVYIVGRTEMTRLNETFLKHKGSTDVITFDYGDGSATAPFSGEIFLCLDEAVLQARRFRTTWQTELARYLVHGMLHLCGYDDRTVAARQKMKRAENRQLRQLAGKFNLGALGVFP